MSRPQTPTERTLHNMTYHPPSEKAQEQLARLRARFKDLVRDIEAFNAPMDGRCQSLMLTNVEDALHWGTKAIVLADVAPLEAP